MKKKNVLNQLSGQERYLSFLKVHGGDGVLPGKLRASFLAAMSSSRSDVVTKFVCLLVRSSVPFFQEV